MSLQAAQPNVVRFPPRLRVVPPSSALDRLLADGTLDEGQHLAGLAYRDLRARYEGARRAMRSPRNGGGAVLPEAAWFALKRRHAALLRAAGAERFMLDRLCLDDDPPLWCEVGRVGAALGRVATARCYPSGEAGGNGMWRAGRDRASMGHGRTTDVNLRYYLPAIS